MVLIKEGFLDLLEPGIREHFKLGSQRRTSMIPTFYNVQDSAKDAEHLRGIGAVSPDSWNQFAKTKRVADVDFDQYYKTTFRHETLQVRMPIEKELIADAQYDTVLDAAGQLGDSATLKREVDGASTFINAFSSSFLGADGVALCSNSHPNGPTSSGTQDNNGTLALSKANVRTVREAMQAFTDDKGNLVAVTPNTILVPPALEDDAREIALSVLDPNTANNTINSQYGRFNVVTWHYLTDSNAWFMIDSVLMKQSLLWFDREPLTVRRQVIDDPAYIYWLAHMRYSYGWRDWRWVYGNNPS